MCVEAHSVSFLLCVCCVALSMPFPYVEALQVRFYRRVNLQGPVYQVEDSDIFYCICCCLRHKYAALDLEAPGRFLCLLFRYHLLRTSWYARIRAMIMALSPMRALIVFSFCFRGPSLSHMCSVMVLQYSDRT